MTSIKIIALEGIVSLGTSKIFQQIVTTLTLIILARLLTPDDFGLLGIASVFLAFINIFSGLGIGSAIVQAKHQTEDQISTLFWLNLFSGIVSCLALLVLARPISKFYNLPTLRPILIVLSLNLLITPFFQIQRKILERNLKFKQIAFATFLAVLLSGIIAISAALAGFGVWSLVFQATSINIFYVIIFYYQSRWLPTFTFKLNECLNQIRFGLTIVGSTFSLYLERNIDSLIIGKILGTTTLGYYSIASRIMYLPIRRISYVMTEVLFPLFSSIQEDTRTIRNGYLKSIRYTSFITFPLMTLIFLFSDELIFHVLGDKWLPSSIIVKILALAGAIQSITQISLAVFDSVGLPEIRMKVSFYSLIFLVAALSLGTFWGVVGISLAVLVSRLAIFFLSQVKLMPVLQFNFKSLFSNLGFSVISCGILFILDIIFRKYMNIGLINTIPNFIFIAFIYCITYIFFLRSFRRTDIVYILEAFKLKR